MHKLEVVYARGSSATIYFIIMVVVVRVAYFREPKEACVNCILPHSKTIKNSSKVAKAIKQKFGPFF